jgi:hypothetical protein
MDPWIIRFRVYPQKDRQWGTGRSFKFENVFKIVNSDFIVYKNENYCPDLQTCKVSNGIMH